MSDIARIAEGLHALASAASDAASRLDGLAPAVEAMRQTLARGGTLFFAGNGGSAADAQHIATEYVVRYHASQRRALRAVALTTDTSLLTAAANDFGFDEVFARQVEALARAGDTLVLHSTSGNSANLVRAAERARAMDVTVVALLGGDGGALAACVDHPFVVSASGTARVQELQLAIQHQIADILTTEFAR